MKKLQYWLFIIPCLFTITTLAINSDMPDEPVISLPDSVIDFGDVIQGENLSKQIKVTNTGIRALKISNVRGSCGLAVISFPRQEIAPGESGTIHFRYDTSRLGNFERILTIHSNSAENTVKIIVKGNVFIK